MKFLADIEVEEGLKDSDGDLGTAGQILSSTGTGTNWIAASGGGGIGGTISSTQVAFGATTGDEIDGVSTFTYSDSGTVETLSLGDATSATSGLQTNFDLSHPNTSTTRARYNLYAGTSAGSLKGYLQSSGNTGEITLLSNANLVLSGGAKVTIDGGSTSDIVIASASGSKVGIGNTNPASKLSVNGGIQIADDADGASADKVGTFKYYTATIGSFDYSYVNMCMQTDTATYEWVNILTNRWAN